MAVIREWPRFGARSGRPCVPNEPRESERLGESGAHRSQTQSVLGTFTMSVAFSALLALGM